MDATTQARWFRRTPGRLVLALLAVQLLLWLSDRFGWFGWHKGYAVLTCVAAVGVAMLLVLLWLGVALVFRRRFQFSLRALLIFVTLCALPCSWLAVRLQEARWQREAVAEIERLGGEATWSKPSGPAWLRKLLGNEFFCDVEQIDLNGTEITDAGLEHLKGLGQLKELHLNSADVTDAGLKYIKGLGQLQDLNLDSTQVTDAGLEHLEGLGQLQTLWLTDTRVTDAGLKYIKGLGQLQDLNLDSTQVTDAGLEHLEGLRQLRDLDLDCTRVTDAGLEHLKGLGKLQSLYLNYTKVTDAGVKQLKEALPTCTIIR